MIYVENTSTDPYFNFALEYYLIHEKQLPEDVFIFWRNEPALMIGKYQNTLEEINENYARDHRIHVVRRVTGGGTIYTDMGSWQFSFIAKSEAKQIEFSRYMVPVIDALNQLGVEAKFNSRNDLVIDGKKFSGNAQCMMNGYTLHHGSLLFDTDLEQMVKCLTADDYKIVSKGIKSVRERVTNIADHLAEPMNGLDFKRLMVQSMMHGSEKAYRLSTDDIGRIRRIAEEKFKSWDWNYGASPKFNITKTGYLDGGKIEFRLDVNKGIIEGCQVYGDFFGSIDISALCGDLVGCRYDRESVKSVLEKHDIDNTFYRMNHEELLRILC